MSEEIQNAPAENPTPLSPAEPPAPAATAPPPAAEPPKAEAPKIDPASLMTPEGLQKYLETVTQLASRNAALEAEKQRQEAEAQAKVEEARRRAMERAAEAGETKKLLELQEQKTAETLARIRAEHEALVAAQKKTYEAEQQRIAAARADAEARAKEVEQRSQQFALAAELGRALSGHVLVDGAADDITRLLKDQFVVVPEGNSFAVRTPTGQTVAEAVRAFLDLKPHYVRSSTTRGGTLGGPFAAQHQPSRPAEPPEPANMGEAVLLHFQGLQAAQGDPFTNPALPMGIRAAR